MLAHIVDLDDVRVLQARDRLGFHAKADQVLGIRRGAGQDHLDRDLAIELLVHGLVDHAHAAAAQDALHLVAGNRDDA